MIKHNEGQSEGNLSIESLFPRDVLPTGYFLAKLLSNFDQEYPNFIPADRISSWNGKVIINGVETIISIGHTHRETRIVLDRQVGHEVWEISERYSDFLEVSMKEAVVPVTVLLPDYALGVQTSYQDRTIMRVTLYYKQKLPLDNVYDEIRRPSELPLITEEMIDLEKSNEILRIGYNWGWGFDSANQAIEALHVLKKAIVEAMPIEFTEDSPPNPSSNRIISEDYFPR